MTWVRKDDQMPLNRKVAPLSDAAYRLDDEALCWCSRNHTDGRIAADELSSISSRAKARNVGELVKRGRWHAVYSGYECSSPYCPKPGPDGWVIHDYLEYNPSKEQVVKDRAAKADRQRRWRERRGRGASTPPVGDAPRDGPGDTARDADGDGGKRLQETLPPARTYPVPPRPAPKEGGGGAPAATAARRQAADAAADGREEDPPPSPPPVVDPQRRAQLAAEARAALRGQPRPAPGRHPPPDPAPPNGVIDNPHFDPAIAARLGTWPPPTDSGDEPTNHTAADPEETP